MMSTTLGEMCIRDRYKTQLKKNGVKLMAATEIISEGPEGIILESVLEGYAEYYLSLIHILSSGSRHGMNCRLCCPNSQRLLKARCAFLASCPVTTQSLSLIHLSAACFGVFLNTKKAYIKNVSLSAGLTGIFGITEPAIYGVTLRLKKPFVCGCIGGAIGAPVSYTHLDVYKRQASAVI